MLGSWQFARASILRRCVSDKLLQRRRCSTVGNTRNLTLRGQAERCSTSDNTTSHCPALLRLLHMPAEIWLIYHNETIVPHYYDAYTDLPTLPKSTKTMHRCSLIPRCLYMPAYKTLAYHNNFAVFKRRLHSPACVNVVYPR